MLGLEIDPNFATNGYIYVCMCSNLGASNDVRVDDEVNLLVPGNFGWDPVPGYDDSVPMTDLVKFPNAVEAIWSSGFPTLALSGAS